MFSFPAIIKNICILFYISLIQSYLVTIDRNPLELSYVKKQKQKAVDMNKIME